MKIRKTKSKLTILLIIATLIYTGIVLNFLPNYKNNDFTNNINKINLRNSATHIAPITINDLPGSPINWTWAKSQGYCTGSGTIGDPYIIQNDIFNIGFGWCLFILNSRKYFRVINCTFRITSGEGIFLFNTTNGFIERNDFYNMDFGVDIANCSYIDVLDNNATMCLAGYLIDNGKFLTISSNLASKCFNGINFNDLHQSSIDKNELYDNYGHGIFSFISHSNSFSENILRNNSNGIYIESSNKNVLSKNTAEINRVNGFYLETSDNNTVIENEAYNNNESGIYLWSDGIDSNYISENHLHFNTLDGITLFESDNNTIENNNAHDNSQDGIRFLSGSDRNIVKDNQITDNHNTGIYLLASSNYNIIFRNTIKANLFHGIRLDNCDNNALTGNLANNNFMR